MISEINIDEFKIFEDMKVVASMVDIVGGGSRAVRDEDGASECREPEDNGKVEKTTEIQDLLRTHDGVDKERYIF